ncbi:hypothetical protein PDESU_00257 [Pontiella desulfatans]|uniref:Uncharacterized protein n=1 Tax=Pontiella desulfatans TaxID=2750659 RepID=A0A6C2TWL3_PONDE|nr:hypothetical protein PDESU_00257 [Pontiella desulfatans]
MQYAQYVFAVAYPSSMESTPNENDDEEEDDG